MKNIIKATWGWLVGVAEEEYHHIAADFESAGNRFLALAGRKRDEAKAATEEAIKQNAVANEALVVVARAESAAAKIKDLVA